MTPVKPGKIIGVGRNYRAHAEELGNPMPAQPIIFLKPTSAIIAPGETIILPPDSNKVEQEAEIGIVVLERLRNVTRDEAEKARIGFTCVNDVTARDLQKVDGQWSRAKGYDTFCPVGPVVQEGLDWRTLEVIGRVNGKDVQRGKASDMAFDIPTLIVFISRVMTLEPGDVIATGTPAGTTALKAGDVTEVEIPGVGVLKNPVA
ncbi:MAG TPA: fumarylacetoacetate hydrolase family protein [Gemmatimonadales bacterium]|nr:fumarylacetoacetate hydrolase family protein [Gemmatimonadales bacterium]